MITFLHKISQLEGIQNVTLLSEDGNLLYHSMIDEAELCSRIAELWQKIFLHLRKPPVVEISFDQGYYYLRNTGIGYLVIVLTDTFNLEKIKRASIKIQAKLSDSSIRKKVLLQFLSSVDETLKPNVIRELISLADRDVGSALTELLRREKEFSSRVRDELLLSLCQAIGHCSFFEAMEPLNAFLQRRSEEVDNQDDVILRAGKISLMQLELEKPNNQETAGLENEKKNAVSDKTPPAEDLKKKNKAQIDSSQEEKRISDLLGQGRKDEAISGLMVLLEKTAIQRRFAKAEQLRDWLIDIDSMALTQIIRAAEIIEEEKISSVQAEHLETWKKLVEMLTEEEFSSLYHTMELKAFKSGAIIAQQGDFFSRLLFVNSGRLQLYSKLEGKEVVLRTVSEGEVIGGATFFEASVWTINVRSLGVEIFLLSPHEMLRLMEHYPSLESKLIDFCAHFDPPISLFANSKRSRRKHERKLVNGRAAVVLLDKTGKKTAIGFKGDLFDISKGGVSFCLRVSRKKNATMLFGKKIHMTIPFAARRESLMRTGVIVAVKGHHVVSNEYSIHVEFDTQLNMSEIQGFS